MTNAPDPGLTDLIAAHAVVDTERRYTYPPLHSPDPFRATGSFDVVTCTCGWKDDNHPAHVASIIGSTHTSFCNDGIEDGTGTAHACVGECAETERVAQAERIAELEAEIARRQEAAEIIGALHAKVCDDVARAVGVEVDPNGDADWAGIFELLAELGDRANATEAAVRRVRDVLTIGPLHRLNFPKYKDPYAIDRHVIRAALEGEQQ
uniref:hypothetical protein n=1 Tax=Rhodococcus erythropolis TaxID=1833 RepID=UPI000BB31C1F|nr:hypothetical protein [Rhodococcus erythropolis]